MKFCCKDFAIRENSRYVEFYNGRTDENIILFDRMWRVYSIFYAVGCSCPIQYCLWCGKKLPDSLANKWLKVLKEDYGIEDPISKDAEKVPAEFLSDEWWKKRSL